MRICRAKSRGRVRASQHLSQLRRKSSGGRSQFRKQSFPFGGRVNGKAMPLAVHFQVGKQAGGILMKVKDTGRLQVKCAAFALPKSIVLSDLSQQVPQGIESL